VKRGCDRFSGAPCGGLDKRSVPRYHRRIMRKIFFVLSAVLLLGLGTFGYVHRAELPHASVSAAVAQGSAWFQKQSVALSAAFRDSTLGQSYQKGMNDYRAQRQQRLAAVPLPAARSTAPPPKPFYTDGQRIANGHAFAKHGAQFGVAGRDQFAAQIDQIIRSARMSDTRHLQRGRTAYWDEASGTVVIVDPNTADGGTAFKPDRGRRYFESLR
jgi:pyocin large subunit-like protein